MIDIHQRFDGPYPAGFIPYPIQFTAIENEGNFKGVQRGKGITDNIRSGKETEIIRRLVLIIDGDVFPETFEEKIKGQLRTDGVAI
jgi:hypothetical protein